MREIGEDQHERIEHNGRNSLGERIVSAIDKPMVQPRRLQERLDTGHTRHETHSRDVTEKQILPALFTHHPHEEVKTRHNGLATVVQVAADAPRHHGE